MARRAIVAGGSIGGLFAAAALLKRGWDVTVYERTGTELSGRGAGIVTHPELVDALEAVGVDITDLGVLVRERVAYDIAGDRVRTLPFEQVVTSWDRIHQGLRRLIPDGAHVLGRTVTAYTQDGETVTARFAEGGQDTADLLIGADGFRSAVRGQMLPEIQPEYAGYVVWRALAQEADLPAEVHASIFGAFGFFLPRGTQIIGYPIAGPGNDLRPGHRRYNFVWYTAVPEADLTDMRTDATGTHHPVSIAPPLIRDDILARMRDDAARRLPPPFVAMLDHGERPFFTPIYDHHSPVMAEGRVALSGDAACVARPHVGMGVTKAAQDALSLARHLDAAPVPQALAAYSAERVPAARAAFERSRRLGGFIFDGPEGANPDGRANPRIETIMRDTAVTVPAG